MQKLSSNLDEFNAICLELFSNFTPGSVVVLEGDLGVGKTTLVKSFAKFLGLKELVTSPTYSLLKQYDNQLCHIDAYRISDENLEIQHYRDLGCVVMIEWATNIADFLPANYYEVKIEYTTDFEERLITFKEVNNG